MFGLTSLGTFHTAISLLAVAAGLIALARYRAISLTTTVGKLYVASTLVVALTGFGIFQHGGFGKPHVLGIVTIIVLGIAVLAGTTRIFGRACTYVEALGYTLTLFFHFIPGITETATRLPLRAPLLSSPDAPEIQIAVGIVFVLFLLGMALQVLRLRAMPQAPSMAAR